MICPFSSRISAVLSVYRRISLTVRFSRSAMSAVLPTSAFSLCTAQHPLPSSLYFRARHSVILLRNTALSISAMSSIRLISLFSRITSVLGSYGVSVGNVILSAVTVPRRSASAVSSSASDISIRRRQAEFSQVQRSWHLHRLSCRRRIRSPQLGHRTGTVSLNMSCALSVFLCVLRPCFVFCIFS